MTYYGSNTARTLRLGAGGLSTRLEIKQSGENTDVRRRAACARAVQGCMGMACVVPLVRRSRRPTWWAPARRSADVRVRARNLSVHRDAQRMLRRFSARHTLIF